MTRVSEPQKHMVALQYLEGSTVAELARKYHYTYSGMYQLLNSDEMQNRMRELRDRVELGAINARAKILLNISELLDASMAVALNPDHKDSSMERRFLIDKVLPTVQRQESRVQHTLSGELAEEVKGLLHEFRKAYASEDLAASMERRVQDGEAAVPRALEASSIALPEGGNGTDTDKPV